MKVSQELIAIMDESERLKVETYTQRNNKIQTFMSIVEGSVKSQENKKYKLLEDNFVKY